MNFADFFAMGGYAFYVWASFGLTFIVLTLMVLATSRWQRRIKKEIAGIIHESESSKIK